MRSVGFVLLIYVRENPKESRELVRNLGRRERIVLVLENLCNVNEP